MAPRLLYSARSDPGRVRESNEDKVFSYVRTRGQGDSIALLIVADGMGGHKAGEVASDLAVNTIFRCLQPYLDGDGYEPHYGYHPDGRAAVIRSHNAPLIRERLVSAIKEANKVIFSYARRHPLEAGNLGTTVACVIIKGDLAVIANVGDSRVYHLRGGLLRQVTIDHSFVGHLVRQGHLAPEDVFSHPQRSVITRALGHHHDVMVDIFRQPLKPGDQLLVCSDGLWEMVQNHADMVQHLNGSPHPEDAVQSLIEAANANGGLDNIGVAVARLA